MHHVWDVEAALFARRELRDGYRGFSGRAYPNDERLCYQSYLFDGSELLF